MLSFSQIMRRTLTETTDGAGNKYLLPDFMKLMDCALCRVAISRRPELAQYSPRPVSRLGMHSFDIHGHARPYCYECWLKLRKANT